MLLFSDVILLNLYFDQQYPISNPRPITKLIKARFDQINGESLVSTPKSKPKIAGAIAEFGPSEIVGVAITANTIIHVIPPSGAGRRLHMPYQHHKIINDPRIYTVTAIVSSGITSSNPKKFVHIPDS